MTARKLFFTAAVALAALVVNSCGAAAPPATCSIHNVRDDFAAFYVVCQHSKTGHMSVRMVSVAGTNPRHIVVDPLMELAGPRR
jgi:hypothetical protein